MNPDGSLDNSHGLHGFGYPHESGDICSKNIVAWRAVGVGHFRATVVDAAHDRG